MGGGCVRKHDCGCLPCLQVSASSSIAGLRRDKERLPPGSFIRKLNTRARASDLSLIDQHVELQWTGATGRAEIIKPRRVQPLQLLLSRGLSPRLASQCASLVQCRVNMTQAICMITGKHNPLCSPISHNLLDSAVFGIGLRGIRRSPSLNHARKFAHRCVSFLSFSASTPFFRR